MSYRIISNDTDYYDFMQKWGVEPDKVWKREATVTPIPFSDVPRSNNSRIGISRAFGISRGARFNRATNGLIGVAGWWYPVIHLNAGTKKAVPFIPGFSKMNMTEDEWLHACVDVEGVKSTTHGWDRYPLRGVTATYHGIIKNEDPYKWVFKDMNLFLEHKTPVISIPNVDDIIRNGTHKHRTAYVNGVINCSLKDNGFTSVKTPEEVWTEIIGFMDGDLATPEEVGNIPDKYMLGSKGFDEWSFKNQKNRRKE